MNEAARGESFSVTIGSPQLGLPSGELADLNVAIAQLNREQLAIRTVAVLAGLFADLDNGMVNVSKSLAGGLGGEAGAAIAQALKKDNAVFVEPMQQLVMLRRCPTVATNEPPGEWSDPNLKVYFDACRYAADVCTVGADEDAKWKDSELAETALVVGASFLLRMSLLNPTHPTHWIARMRLMLRDLPKEDARAKPWAERLENRISSTFGITFDAVGRLVGMLTLWSLRFKTMAEVFKPGAGIGFKLDTWLSKTKIPEDDLLKFFNRTARKTDEFLTDDKLGGPISILPFRDRPFVQFADGAFAPVYPALVSEKLTYDLFWWAGTPEKKQDHPWQRDWGDLVELYVVRLLNWIATQSGCGFKADIKWGAGQLDAAMWFKGHVALFEISAGMMTDLAAHMGDPEALRDGLTRTLVRSKSDGKDKDEAVAQVARDIKALLAGELQDQIGISDITRVYPVVIAIDRRVRVPGLRFWFDKVFSDELTAMAGSDRARVGALAVLALEDLEVIEQLVRDNHQELKGTPRGLIKLLRLWEMRRDRLPKLGVRAAAWHQFMRDMGATEANDRLQAEADKWWAEVKNIFKEQADVTVPPVELGT